MITVPGMFNDCRGASNLVDQAGVDAFMLQLKNYNGTGLPMPSGAYFDFFNTDSVFRSRYVACSQLGLLGSPSIAGAKNFSGTSGPGTPRETFIAPFPGPNQA